MKKTQFIVMLLVLLLLGGLAVNGRAYFMVIDVIQKKAGSVFFPHHLHLSSGDAGGVGLACDRCHHELKQAKNKDRNPTVCVSEKCHPAEKIIALNSNRLYIKDAFHKLCKGCHKTSRSKFPKAPTNCSGCHQKELIPFSELRKKENLAD